MSGSTSSLFSALARLSLIVTLVAAPWPFGGYPLAWQPPLFAGVLASLLFWWISVLTRPVSHPDGGTILVDSLLPPLLLVCLAALQLIPFANVPEVPAHAVLADAARAEIEASSVPAPTPISVSPAMTRVTAARLLFGLAAAFLGIQLFRDAGTRMWLYVPIALNAAAISAFGMWQQSHWDEWQGLLFGTVPLQQGGYPFGPFVNRNNGAGMLNLGVAAAAAWAFLAAAPRIGRAFQRVSDDRMGSSRGLQETPRSNAIVPGLLVVIICAGVASSLSRGGILGLGAAIVAAVLILLQSRRSRMVASLLMVVAPLLIVAVAWLGAGKEIRKRFSVLTSYTAPQDNRVDHWSETWGAVQDAPWLGQGMGAYRYIHRPYLRTEFDRWYLNADNQFFEVLVENGIAGVALVAGLIWLLLVDVRRLLVSRAPWEQRDAALLGGILIASQATQGLTDFGITLPANMLTAATLAGVVAGTAARSLPFSLVPNLSSPMVFRSQTAVPIGLVLIAALGLAWREVGKAATANAAVEAVGVLDAPDAIHPDGLNVIIARTQQAADTRPDDAELQRTLGNLLTFRFRTNVFEALKKDAATQGAPEEQLWSRTSLEPIFSEAAKLEEESDQARFSQLLERADPSDSLQQANAAYESALAGCRWVAAAAQRNALTQTIIDHDLYTSRRSVALAVAGAPSEGSRLILLGAIARQLGADDLAIAAWKQAMVVGPQRLGMLVATGGDWLADPARLSAVLPNDIEALLAFAESPAGTALALPIADHAEQLVAKDVQLVNPAGQTGRILRLRGKRVEALEKLESAVREEPLAWMWRFRIAVLKEEMGRLDEAVRDLEAAKKDFPRQSVIETKLLELQQKALTPGR